MTRDREATAGRILAAAFDTLGAEGFGGFGVNSVARAAGCDKQLIYRYFGGIDGLMAAMGQAAAARLAAALAPALLPRPDSYAALIGRLAAAYLDAVLEDPWQRRMALVEAAAPPAPTDSFRAARGEVLQNWLTAARGDLVAPKGTDAPAINALLIAAVQGLALTGAAGLTLPNDRDRLHAALAALVAAIYAP